MASPALPLLVRIALLLGASVLVSVMRRRVGRGAKRNLVMFAGTIGGVVVGALIATPLSHVYTNRTFDALDVSMLTCILIGWAVAWPIARAIPN
ncbi:MAG TPA: hypothetical protein VFA59_05980 [Vicinamibacterales bacterium]|nr:hypothetical protein [Vicinamibacterales bacterium]